MSDNANVTPSEKKSRNSYTLEKKLKSIATAKRLDNVDKALQQEGVPRTCLMKWLEEEVKLKEAIRTRGKDTKKLSRGRPIKLKEFDCKPKRLLVWDAFKAHTSEDTKKVLKTLKLHTSVIPGGCTRFIQPADVSWNKPFKARFQQLYDQWMLDGKHETTAAGNPKPPPPDLYLEWVLEAWYDGVTKDNVINSFKACGIGAVGAADDHLIHCLKEGNGIPNGLYELTKAREAAEAQELAEILTGFEIEAPDEDDTGHVSDIEVVDDESGDSGEENSEQEDVNHNLSDDSDF